MEAISQNNPKHNQDACVMIYKMVSINLQVPNFLRWQQMLDQVLLFPFYTSPWSLLVDFDWRRCYMPKMLKLPFMT